MKTAEQLVREHPGAFERRRQIILALCQSALHSPLNSKETASYIVALANRIIEETEQ